jgi:glycosyltransferase involved in cell wall biosynthesis
MHVAITLECRFTRTADDKLWTRDAHGYSFWERYLTVFEGVKIIARAGRQQEVDERYHAVLGPGVRFVELPYYLGPWQYLKMLNRIRNAMRRAVEECDAILCRVPSQIGTELLSALPWTDHPYGLEVIGDPHQAFAPGAIRHPLRPMFRYSFTRNVKRECIGAAAVSYVTERALQQRYATTGYSVGVSDVDLPGDYFAPRARKFRSAPGDGPSRLLFIGTLEQMYKGQDILLRAVSLLNHRKHIVDLVMVGDGRHRIELESLAASLSIAGQVRFVGQLPAGNAIRAELDASTLMVLPSRSEGLPRVIVEAMARALPCVASDVGGISELLDGEDIVPPNNPELLARKVEEVISNPARLALMSARNLQRAQRFRPEFLERQRTEFYRFLRNATEEWLSSRSGQHGAHGEMVVAPQRSIALAGISWGKSRVNRIA